MISLRGSYNGSSPLTRGKRMPVCVSDNRFRLIPAHAGKTTSCCRPGEARRAHPRSRGENGDVSRRTSLSPGSSPLTRGKRKHIKADEPFDRLIPAHAGKTAQAVCRPRACEAHPRSRGENLLASQLSVSFCGSSPLTRGKPAQVDYPSDRTGLIPAHAGKTRDWRAGRRRTPAHPRSRGENSDLLLGLQFDPGSSPLTRGKRCAVGRRLQPARLIPAHAGKTSAMPST